MFSRVKDVWVILSFVGILFFGVHSASAWCDDSQKQASLYDRLGGLIPLSVLVSDFVEIIVNDVVLNANPAVGSARKHVPAPYLKYQVTAMVCQSSGGPCVYHGRDIKSSHAYKQTLSWVVSGRTVVMMALNGKNNC